MIIVSFVSLQQRTSVRLQTVVSQTYEFIIRLHVLTAGHVLSSQPGPGVSPPGVVSVSTPTRVLPLTPHLSPLSLHLSGDRQTVVPDGLVLLGVSLRLDADVAL